MRKQTANPLQTSFGIELEALRLPGSGVDSDVVREAATFTIEVPQYVPVYTVTLRRSDVASLQGRTTIRCPGDAATLIWDRLQDADREHLLVLLLDTKNRVIGINTVSIGILDSSLVHPREVYKPAIITNAAAIILAHNHPSGDPSPSCEDQQVTKRIKEAGDILGIEVPDHVAVGEQGRYLIAEAPHITDEAHRAKGRSAANGMRLRTFHLRRRFHATEGPL